MTALDRRYRDELHVALRMYDISGRRVGDVLAEVETHVAETGEDPVEAFGTPREYAAEVAAHLDPSTGKPSRLQNIAAALRAGALSYVGIVLLRDGLWSGGASTVPYTLADVVSTVLALGLMVAGVMSAFRAATAITNRKVHGWVSAGLFLTAISSIIVTSWLVNDATSLFEVPRWVAAALGAALLAVAVLGLRGAIKRGRVVDPR